MSVSACTRGRLQLWPRLPSCKPHGQAAPLPAMPSLPPGTGTPRTDAHPHVPICTSCHCVSGRSPTCSRLRPVWPSLPTAVRAAPCPCPDTGAHPKALVGSQGCCCGASPVLPSLKRETCLRTQASRSLQSAGCDPWCIGEQRGQMWPGESCPHPWWAISATNLIFHSPVASATLDPFSGTMPPCHTECCFYFLLAYSLPFKASHKTCWLDPRRGKKKDTKISENNHFKSSFFLFRKELISFL